MARTCAACGVTTSQPSARWCGHCGARLATDGAAPTADTGAGDTGAGDTRAASAGMPVTTLTAPERAATLVSAPAPALVLDDLEPEEEVTPPPWSARARALTTVVVVLAVLGGLQLRPDPEPVFDPRGFTARGDEARSGVVSLAPLEPPTQVLWEQEVPIPPIAGSVTSGGDVVVETGPDGLLAVRDAVSGEVRWARRDTDAGPVAVAGEVVVQVGPTELRAYDLASGAGRWTLPAGGDERPVVLPDGDLLVVAPSTDTVTRVDDATGEVAWTLDLRDRAGASIVDVQVSPELLVVWGTSPFGLAPTSGGATHLAVPVDPATGEVPWIRSGLSVIPGLAENAVTVGDGTVVTVDRAGLLLLDGRDGRVRAEVPLEGIPSGLAATGRVVVVGIPGTGVVGVDLRTAEVRWTRRDLGGTSTLRTAGASVVVEVLGADHVLHPGSGATVTELADPSGPREAGLPAPGPLAAGPIAFRDGDGAVVVDPETGETSSWPLLLAPRDPPAVAEDRVFVSRTDGVEVRGAGEGEVVWSFADLPPSLGPDGTIAVTQTPAVAGTTVVLSPPTGWFRSDASLTALERTGGIRAWDRSGDNPLPRGPLTLAADTVFVPVGDEIHGYDTVNGRRSFAAVAEGPRGPLVVSASRVIGGPARTPGVPDGDTVVAVLRRDRSISWRAPLDVCSGPALAGDVVVFGTTGGVGALAEASGARRWEVATGLPVCADPVVVGGRAVVLDGARGVRGLEVATGETAWAVELPSPAVAPPVAAGDTLLVPLLDGRLVGLHLGAGGAPGTVAWSLDLGVPAASSPVVADGRVIVHLRDGRLVAVGS